jgi:hypothetical protein
VSSFPVDGMAVPWEASSPLWSLSADSSADAFGRGGLGMVIRAAAGDKSEPPPFAERRFTPPLDLRGADELRLWLRSTRPGDGGPARPFYLVLEATTDPPGAGTPWRRFLPVAQPDMFALHSLWLGDMPAGLRQALGVLRIRSLDVTVAFEAAVDDLVAVRPEAVQDVDGALLARFHNAFEVDVAGSRTPVPAILDVPENPGARTPPFILITPWSVVPLERRSGTDESIDNYTDGGAFVRTPPASLQLEFRLDVFAGDRTQKAQLLELIVGSILSDPRLIAANAPLTVVPFVPSSEEAATIAPGRTPLFVRVNTEVETGPRRLLGFAVPFVLAGPADGRETAELTAV